MTPPLDIAAARARCEASQPGPENVSADCIGMCGELSELLDALAAKDVEIASLDSRLVETTGELWATQAIVVMQDARTAASDRLSTALKVARERIDNAEHGRECKAKYVRGHSSGRLRHRTYVVHADCDCWKANALAEIDASLVGDPQKT